MKAIVLAVFVAGLTACSGVDLRYTPLETPAALSSERFIQIRSIDFKDASGGLMLEGASVSLNRPFYDSFRDAAAARLDSLKIPISKSKSTGAFVDIELTRASLKRGTGAKADLTATVTYAVVVRNGVEAMCREEASAWASFREGQGSASAVDALQMALSKAVDRLGFTIADSCLYRSASGEPVTAAVRRDPKVLAVVIGIERYRNEVPSANFAENDARAVAAAMKNVLGASDDRVLLLLNDWTTLADLQKHFERWLPAHAGPQDKVIVYFAGNGAVDSKNRAEYLLPYDGDLNALAETALPLSRFYAALGRLRAGATVVLDACFSGSGARSAPAADARPLRAEEIAPVPSGVTVIRAAGPAQTCGLDKNGGGLFTHYFLKGLKEREGNLKAAFDFLQLEVKKAARDDLNIDQDPQWQEGK